MRAKRATRPERAWRSSERGRVEGSPRGKAPRLLNREGMARAGGGIGPRRRATTCERSEPRDRSERGEAASEGAWRGVRGAKPLGYSIEKEWRALAEESVLVGAPRHASEASHATGASVAKQRARARGGESEGQSPSATQ